MIDHTDKKEPTAVFQPVRRGRVSDEVVVRLVHGILDGEFSPDEKLPPERELARRLSINRTSLREALRRLEEMGLIRVRQGDGIFVRDHDTAAGLEFVKFLLTHGIGLDKQLILNLAETRRVVGEQIIALAAVRMTPEHLARLEEIVAAYAEEGADPVRYQAADFAFFHAIAVATGNRVFVYVLNTIRDVMQQMAGLYRHVEGDANVALALYRELVAAFAAGDADRAVAAFHARTAADDQRLTELLEGLL